MADTDDRPTEAAEIGETEDAVRAAEFDLDKFRRDCVIVHELLNQATYWVDVHGRRLPIREMSVGYKANCLAFMRRRVGYFASRYPWGAIFAMELPSGWTDVMRGHLERNPATGKMEPVGGPMLTRGQFMLDDGGNMSAAFDEYVDSVFDRCKNDPEGWLDDTPLMKALADQVLAGEGGAVGTRPEDAPREIAAATLCDKCGKPAYVSMHRRSGGIVRLCTGEWVRLV